MKKFVVYTIASFCLIAALGITGCAHDAVSTAATTNIEVKVDLLFEHDGCKMYRFEDEGYYHYWANCESKDSISVMQPAGKSRRPDSLDTFYSKHAYK